MSNENIWLGLLTSALETEDNHLYSWSIFSKTWVDKLKYEFIVTGTFTEILFLHICRKPFAASQIILKVLMRTSFLIDIDDQIVDF